MLKNNYEILNLYYQNTPKNLQVFRKFFSNKITWRLYYSKQYDTVTSFIIVKIVELLDFEKQG
jgi:hypothetical protein